MKQKLLMSLALSAAAQIAVPLHAATPAATVKAAPASQVPFQRSNYALKQQRFVLKNGLTLIVHEDHSVPVVAVNLWYHVGSRNEQRGKTGFAHLFEHFFFNGSENYPHGFREAMDDLGASNRNGTTDGDRTNFYEDVPVSALERALYLESDRMGYLGNYISKEMLERERGVVQNEKRQGENQPYGRVWQEISAQMYPYSHPYSWSTIGSMDDLNAASLDDIKQWYRTYYGPNNAVISLAGDITPERALALVTQYFGAIPPGPPLPRTQSWIPRLDSNIRSEMEDRVPQARIYRSYHAPAVSDPEVARLSLLADVLAGSKSSRLVRRLVYDKNLATSVQAGVNEGELGSTFNIIVTVKPGVSPADAEREMESVLQQLLVQGPTAAELARVKTSALAEVARGNERLGRRANQLSENATFGATPEAYLDKLEAVASATPEQVRRGGAAWLNGYSHTMTVKPFAQLAAENSTLDRKLLPALGTPPDVAFPAIERTQLKNGVKVVLLQRHAAPIVNVTLALDAGSASDSAAKAGTASLAMDLLDKGTRTRNAFELSDALESLGASLSSSSLDDLSLLRLQSTAGNLAPSLALMADAALQPAFGEDLFAQQKQRRLAQIGQEKAQPTSLAMRIVPAILYGTENAYGRPASGDVNSVQGLTRADVAQWHATWFKPGSATLIVTGDTTLAQLMPALEASFGSWKGGSAPAKVLAAPGRTVGKRVFLIDKPDAPQSTILAAHLSLPPGQPEDLAMEPLMQNFGGMATSRLNRNLRLDKHWSYGTSGVLTRPRGQRAFMVLAPVQTDKTREAMQEVAKEIRDVAGERPVQGEEFNSIMRNMNSRLAGRFETLAALDSAALTSLNQGLPDTYWSAYSARMRTLDEAQLASAGARFVRPDELVWLVIGDLRKIEARVRELGWGEVTVLDVDGKPVAK
ncbi:pitrilysin family protein [Janthinobacterium sp. UMAB-60]|uniref:M16 family metallopeptidase n=1 Tax=Janthinobacterium sp. UMAB-60 TaxID=1365365 RepID=UPI001C578998|nr:pitrilysin family protein [Janthinobacterium sp. UMAB-60]